MPEASPVGHGLYAIRFDDQSHNAYEDLKAALKPASMAEGASDHPLLTKLIDHWKSVEVYRDKKLKPDARPLLATPHLALARVLEEAKVALQKLQDAALGSTKTLGNVFQLLDDTGDKGRPGFREAEKLKASQEPKMLRLYGIRIHDSLYIMTGWSLKLGDRMSDYLDGLIQLDRFEAVNEYLRFGLPDDNLFDQYLNYFQNRPFPIHD